MRETENERRFKREMILRRVCLHLANRRDLCLPGPYFRAIADAHSLVTGILLAALDEHLTAMGSE